MTFSKSEGWAVLAALKGWTAQNPQAAEVEKWQLWAKDLDEVLRR